MADNEVEEEFNITLIDPTKLDEEERKAQRLSKIDKQIQQGMLGLEKQGGLGKLAGQPNRMKQGAIKADKENADLRDTLDKAMEKMDELESKIGRIGSIAANPMGAITGQLMKNRGLMMLGKIGAIMMATKMVYDIILSQIKSLFEPGAIFDVRKKVLESVKTIPELEYLLNIRKGTVFFSANTSISQLPADRGNTDRLRDGEMRFTHLYLGDTIGS